MSRTKIFQAIFSAPLFYDRVVNFPPFYTGNLLSRTNPLYVVQLCIQLWKRSDGNISIEIRLEGNGDRSWWKIGRGARFLINEITRNSRHHNLRPQPFLPNHPPRGSIFPMRPFHTATASPTVVVLPFEPPPPPHLATYPLCLPLATIEVRRGMREGGRKSVQEHWYTGEEDRPRGEKVNRYITSWKFSLFSLNFLVRFGRRSLKLLLESYFFYEFVIFFSIRLFCIMDDWEQSNVIEVNKYYLWIFYF